MMTLLRTLVLVLLFSLLAIVQPTYGELIEEEIYYKIYYYQATEESEPYPAPVYPTPTPTLKPVKKKPKVTGDAYPYQPPPNYTQTPPPAQILPPLPTSAPTMVVP